MSGVNAKDLQLRRFFEETMGMDILHASFARGTLTFTMRNHETGLLFRYEQNPDTSISIKFGDVTRRIPGKAEIENVLGHEPTDLEVCRLVQNVILRMIEDEVDETKKDVAASFDRYSRRGH